MFGAFFGHHIFGNGRTSSLVFGNLRWSSGAFGSLLKYIVVKWPKTPGYTKQNNTGLFGAVFCFFLEKIYCFKDFFAVSVNCFMLQSQKKKWLVLSRYPHSDQSIKQWKCCVKDMHQTLQQAQVYYMYVGLRESR